MTVAQQTPAQRLASSSWFAEELSYGLGAEQQLTEVLFDVVVGRQTAAKRMASRRRPWSRHSEPVA